MVETPQISWDLTVTEKVSTTLTEMAKVATSSSSQAASGFVQLTEKLNQTESASQRLKVSIRDDSNEFTRARDQARAYTEQMRGVAAEQNAVAAQARAAREQLHLMQEAAQPKSSSGGLFGSFLGANVATMAIQATAGGLLDLIKNSGQATASLESIRTSYAGLLGSASAANDEIAKMRELANHTNFTFEGLADGERKFLNLKMSASDSRDLLLATGNALAAAGKSSAEYVDRGTTALAQMGAKGKVSSEELQQLAELGIPALDMLAHAMGRSTAETQKLVEAGKIGADQFFAAWKSESMDRFGDAMAAQSHTLQGLASTAGDVGQTLLSTFGDVFVQASGLEPRVESIVTWLSQPQTAEEIKKWATAAGDFAGHVFDAVGTLGQLLGIQIPEVKNQTDQAAGASAGLVAQWKAQAAAVDTSKDRLTELQTELKNYRTAQDDLNYADERHTDQLRDQLTLLERQYGAEDKQARLAELKKKLHDDEITSVAIYTSTGQEAARRAADERVQIAQLERDMRRDAAKQEKQDQIEAVDDARKVRQKDARDRERDLQQQIDDLKKAATGSGTPATDPPPSSHERWVDLKNRIADARAGLGDFEAAAKDLVPDAKQIHTQLLTTLFGTSAEQNNMGNELLRNFFEGVGAGIGEWAASKGKKNTIIALIMGGETPEVAFHNWLEGNDALSLNSVMGASDAFNKNVSVPFLSGLANADMSQGVIPATLRELGGTHIAPIGSDIGGSFGPTVSQQVRAIGGMGPQKVEVVLTTDDQGLLKLIQKSTKQVISSAQGIDQIARGLYDHGQGNRRGSGR